MTEPNQRPSEELFGELAALADGSLPEARRAELEHAVAASPALRAELERQREALAAIAALNSEVRAPDALRERIEAERAPRRRAATAPPRSTRPLRARWPIFGGLAAIATALLLAIVVLPGSDPTVADAAELASLPSAAPAPDPAPGEPALLAADLDGLAYPNWEKEFGWLAAGERQDDLDGRATRTVFYEKDGNRLAYTIVGGDPIEPPENGQTTVVDGVEFTSFEQDGKGAVTWLRDGHTCVLVAADVDEPTLVELAAWKGDGAVSF